MPRTFAERQAGARRVQEWKDSLELRDPPVWVTHRSRPIPEHEARALRRRYRSR